MDLFHEIMFRPDNTEGYTQSQLDAFNDELAARIRFIADSDTDSAYEIAKAFADEIPSRIEERPDSPILQPAPEGGRHRG